MRVKKESDIMKLQLEINQFTNWCHDNHLKVNETKTVHIAFRKKSNINLNMTLNRYTVNASPVTSPKCTKDLEILFDEHLTFKSHVAAVIMKSNQLIEFLRRKKKKLKTKK